jgi:UDP-2,3-diacylglucosamine pyrophosphatase LpxH
MNTLVLSDLHLGNGGSYDIFAGEAELPKLLATLVGTKVHVVLNGDTFDFLMNDEPLALRPARADAQARALIEHPGTQAVLSELGKIARGGGQVTFRSGNHDLEIGLPSVQAVVLLALGSPPSGIVFSVGEKPLLLATEAGAVLIAHGEREDDWNRFVHADVRPDNAAFRYPPGSKLVKTILNRLKKDRGLRFADLLKPDFSGAVLAALAVQPSAVSEVGRSATGDLVFQLVKRKTTDPDALVESADAGERLAASSPIDAAGLTDEEQLALEMLTDYVAQPEGFVGARILARALEKIGTASLRAYASAHRFIAGDGSAGYFSLMPEPAEWKAACALGAQHGAKFVVAGHTHAARWARDGDFSYLNTGTWIHLMRLPAHTATRDEWAEFLELLKRDPGLSGGAKDRLEQHFTCAWIDESAGPSLRAWDGTRLVLLEPSAMKT